MSNKNIVNFSGELERFYYSPIFSVNNVDFQNIYVFLGNNEENYLNSNNEILYSDFSLKQIYNNIIFMKKINLNDISLVIERIDWKQNTVYENYDATKILHTTGSDGKLIKKFYVRNKYDQVFKCLWNNTTVTNSFSITKIIINEDYLTIKHTGGNFIIGEYLSVLKSEPAEYNGIYKVLRSSIGSVDVSYEISNRLENAFSVPYEKNGLVKVAAKSTVEPMFDTGTFDEEKIIQTSDGYKWKYIYTLDKAAKLKFFDDKWMPVPLVTSKSIKNPKNSKYGYGSIDTIDIVNQGSGYPNGVGTVLVNIEGDGYGANATSLVVGGKLTQITLNSQGKNYTKASITLDSLSTGSGAEINYTISPIGGHGSNPARELFAKNLIISSSFVESEGNQLLGDFSFNQIGILYNPFIETDSVNIANNSTISRIISLNVSQGSDKYVLNEKVSQTNEYGKTTYIGKIISSDETNNILRVINKEGTVAENLEIVGEISGAKRTITSTANSINQQLTYTPFSGDIFYLENREMNTKPEKGIELVKILLNYTQ